MSLDKALRERSISLKYGIPYSKYPYIKTLVKKEFRNKLDNEVENVGASFSGFLVCNMKKMGEDDETMKSIFIGSKWDGIISKVNNKLKEESIQKLWNDYGFELTFNTNILLVKVADILSSL